MFGLATVGERAKEEVTKEMLGGKRMDESGFEPETFRMLSERATNCATRPLREVVPSGIEPLILALLAPRLNQLGQGTFN